MDACVASGLRHATCHGFHSAVDPTTHHGFTRLLKQIHRSPWMEKPGGGDAMYVCRFGVRTGAASRLLALDFDEHRDNAGTSKGGLATLRRLRDEGKVPLEGSTLEARTPTGGRHVLFRLPEGRWQSWKDYKQYPSLDVQAEGKFVRIAPTLNYEWIVPPGGPWLDAPSWTLKQANREWDAREWIEDVASSSARRMGHFLDRLADQHKTLSNAGHGERNNGLHELAWRVGLLVCRGLEDEHVARSWLYEAAQANGLWHEDRGPAQVTATVNSAFSWARGIVSDDPES